MNKSILNLLILLCCILPMKQSFAFIINQSLQPLSEMIKLEPLVDSSIIRLPPLRIMASSTVISKTSAKSQFKPLQIAQAYNIQKSIVELGQWQHINGQSVWRLDVQTSDSRHMNFGFKNVHLPESATLFVIDLSTKQVLAAYSAQQNKFHGELWTPQFNANNIQLQLNILTSEMDQLSLSLQQADRGVININKATINTKSGSCNVDVVCPQADNWRDELRSVARYTISTGTGTFLCTGTLINNTKIDHDPLFLTAAHCLVSDTTAASMVFYWNYQTSVCDGTPDGNLTDTQTGASLIARWEGTSTASDFALVRLDSMPERISNVYYAGWDRRDQIHSSATTIHHPSGDEKRISFENDPLTMTDISGTVVNPQGKFFRIETWDEGTTEGGSSGAGLWNSSKHLIGTLTGGDASCLSPTTSDWFGRLAVHWIGNASSTNQLSVHLDPRSANETILNGVDYCDAPLVSISPSANVPALNELVTFSSTVTGGSNIGYTYQWDFNNDGIVDSTVANPSFTYTSASNNRISLVVTDSMQCPGIANTIVLVEDSTEVFVKNGQLPTDYTKQAESVGSWKVDDSTASEGQFSLRSQTINGDEDSSIEYSGNFNAGSISFDRKISSEANFDFFRFYIDDVQKTSLTGELDWGNVSFSFNTGNHTFRWSFEKDAAASGGEDASWIDNVVITEDVVTPPPPPPPLPPPAPKPSSGGGGSIGLEFLFLYLLIILRPFYVRIRPGKKIRMQ